MEPGKSSSKPTKALCKYFTISDVAGFVTCKIARKGINNILNNYYLHYQLNLTPLPFTYLVMSGSLIQKGLILFHILKS